MGALPSSMSVSAFCHCDKLSETTDLETEKDCSVSVLSMSMHGPADLLFRAQDEVSTSRQGGHSRPVPCDWHERRKGWYEGLVAS